ncbi:MAG: hypothetical protein ACR2K6_05310 [Solirubrobacterales bacterium]
MASTAPEPPPFERVVILSVVAAVLALEVWFFFYAEYSLPG